MTDTTLDSHAIQELLCERLCQDVQVVRRFDGALMVRTRFRFPDGDSYPIHLSVSPSGAIRLSDRGHTLMHISYEHDVDSFMDGTRGMLMERIMTEHNLQWDEGAFALDTSPEKLSEAVFVFGQALTRIYDLTLLSRSNVGSAVDDILTIAEQAAEHQRTMEVKSLHSRRRTQWAAFVLAMAGILTGTLLVIVGNSLHGLVVLSTVPIVLTGAFVRQRYQGLAISKDRPDSTAAKSSFSLLNPSDPTDRGPESSGDD